jgi:O-antigen ligase
LIIAFIFSALFGIYQYYFGLNFALVKQLNPNTTFEIGDVIFVRVVGPFGNSLNFAHYLSVLSAFSFALLISSRNKKEKLLTGSAFVIGLLALVFTLSRGAVLALLISITIALIFRFKKKISFLVLIILLLFAIMPKMSIEVLLPEGLLKRSAIAVEEFESSRVSLWYKAIPMFLHYPVLGVGPGNINAAGQNFGVANSTDVSQSSGHLESVYLAILISLGLFGLIPFIGMIVTAIFYCYKNYFKKAASVGVKSFSFALGTSLLSTAINMIANPALLIDVRIAFLFTLLLGLTIITSNTSKVLIKEEN